MGLHLRPANRSGAAPRMPAITWSDIDSAFTPLPSWRFYTTFPDAVVNANGQNTGQSSGQDNAKTLAIEVQRVSIPLLSMEPETVAFGPSVRNFAATRTIDALAVTFMEDVNMTVMTSFLNWAR